MSDQSEAPVLFVHVMKTGGSTLFQHLQTMFPGEEMWPQPCDLRWEGTRLDVRHHLSFRYLAALPEERRRQIRVYAAHLPYAAHESLGPVQTVTVLRDPVERTLSLLRQLQRAAPGVTDPAKCRPLADAPLEEVYENPDVYEPLVHNHQTKLFSITPRDGDTYLDVVDIDDDRLEAAKANLDAVDVVGVTDQYDTFLDRLESRFGWVVPRDVRANVTPRDSHGVSDAFRQRIAEDNRYDVALYEHARRLA